MPPHGLELSHVLKEQQSLLHCVGHVAGLPLLKVPDGGIGWQRSSIQHWSRDPRWRSDLSITPSVISRLPHSGLFGSSCELSLIGGVGFSSLHHLLTLLLPLPFVVCGIRLKRLGGWRGKRLGLSSLPRHFSPWLGLRQLLEG